MRPAIPASVLDSFGRSVRVRVASERPATAPRPLFPAIPPPPPVPHDVDDMLDGVYGGPAAHHGGHAIVAVDGDGLPCPFFVLHNNWGNGWGDVPGDTVPAEDDSAHDARLDADMWRARALACAASLNLLDPTWKGMAAC